MATNEESEEMVTPESDTADHQTNESDSQEAMRKTAPTSPEVFKDPGDANQREVDESIERGDRTASNTGVNLQS